MFCLSLHYNESNNFLYVNSVKKFNDKTELNGYAYDFSIDNNTIDASYTVDLTNI